MLRAGRRHHAHLGADAGSRDANGRAGPVKLSTRDSVTTPVDPKLLSKCEDIENSDWASMECEYKDIWTSEFECSSMLVNPSTAVKKLLDYMKQLVAPGTQFNGSKEWCEEQRCVCGGSWQSCRISCEVAPLA